MPNYEYKCEKCGTVFEKRQSFADQPLTTHPECGGPVHRVISAPAFQLKGTGWYATDYAKSGSSSSPASSGNGEKTEKTETKTESTPATTTTTTETKNS
jgi:putative FmdB family regulatory protein